MIISVSDREFFFLRDLIRKKTEILLGDNKKYLVETRLSPLLVESGCDSFDAFCRLLDHSRQSMKLMDRIVEAITTNETYWFRDEYPFSFIRDHVLPEAADAFAADGEKKLRIWSAAASYGQEAYSIAMTVNEFSKTAAQGRKLLNAVSIMGTDISGRAIEKAIAGVYTNTDIQRGLPEDLHDLYFRRKDHEWVLDGKIRSMVDFSVFNLQAPFPQSWEKFDIIFLRNVIIYFSDPFKKIIFDRISRKLVPGGILFLGTGESVSGYTDSFTICDYKKAKYYRLADR